MIRYAKPEQIAPLPVFSALVLTRTHLNPCHFWDIAGEISKWKKVWDYHWNNLLKSIQLKYQGQWAYVHAHILVGFLFVSCFPPPHWQCKELHRSFCSFENPPDNVGSWLLAWAGWILKKKKREKKALSPVTTPALHILHSGPDFLRSLSKTALVFWGSFGSGWRMSISKGNPQKVKSATQVGITMSAA